MEYQARRGMHEQKEKETDMKRQSECERDLYSLELTLYTDNSCIVHHTASASSVQGMRGSDARERRNHESCEWTFIKAISVSFICS